MIFNLANLQELAGAREYLNQVARLGKRVEIKRKAEHRTLQQNSYLHLILGYFGTQTGYTTAEAKTLYKRLNADLYIYEKNNAKFLKSSADLSKEDMMKSIDKFITYSEDEGIPLPAPDNQDFLDLATNTVEAQKSYL
jgi:hypothetical protein